MQWRAALLGAGTSVAFIVIDMHYSLNVTIADIYLADAAAELIFFFAWVVFIIGQRKKLGLSS
jgi:hypothetical protein